jgi:hypothetical protein
MQLKEPVATGNLEVTVHMPLRMPSEEVGCGYGVVNGSDYCVQ